MERFPSAVSAGGWGMAMLVASEATLFGALIGTYFYLRFVDLHWPNPGSPEPRVLVPLLAAAVLAATSVPMWLATRLRRRVFLLVALVVQCGYFAYEVHDFAHQLHSSTPQDNAYSSIYYTLLGADHAHVFVGILLTLWALWQVRSTRVVSIYWHAVNVLTLVVAGVLASGAV
jgi:cytochrome c oxidase subunit 3